MLKPSAYWMGRDLQYAAELTAEIEANAAVTIDRINQAVGLFEIDTGIALTEWASGWRPGAVNAATPGAAKGSKHQTAEAGDVRDTPNRDFARWCLKNLDQLEAIGLWMEDPRHTWHQAAGGKPWVHLQTVPPGSRRRIFIASDKPATAPLLVEQGGVA